MKVGDSVIVRAGVLDPDFGADIGGWQGRVVEMGAEGTICIQWDSITLSQIPDTVIGQSEEQGLDWTLMWLAAQEVKVTTPRDTLENVAQTQRKLAAQSTWLGLGGEQGRRVQKVLAGIAEDDEMVAFSAWKRYLKAHLVFPFEAEVSEYQEYGPIRAGDRVIVQRITGVEDLYGVLVQMVWKGYAHEFPLCDLEVVDKNSPNYQPVDDYAVWFANR